MSTHEQGGEGGSWIGQCATGTCIEFADRTGLVFIRTAASRALGHAIVATPEEVIQHVELVKAGGLDALIDQLRQATGGS